MIVCTECGHELGPADPVCRPCGARVPEHGWRVGPCVGAVVGSYRLVALLGRGGMGEVWKARHLTLEQQIAVVKFMLATPHAAPPEHLEARVLREAETLASIKHPSVPPLYDLGFTRDYRPYMIMQFVDGETLSARVAGTGRLPPGRALRLAGEVAEFLTLAHGRGIIHRDLKPANLMLVDDERVGERIQIIDFGIAKTLHDLDSVTGNARAFLGTPEYAAPEQIDGSAQPASDQFSLGCVLYFMLTGQSPFRGETPQATLQRVLTHDPPAPSSIVPEVPAEVDGLVGRMMAKAPEARFADMVACEAAIDALRQRHATGEHGRPRSMRPVGVQRARTPVPARSPTPTPVAASAAESVAVARTLTSPSGSAVVARTLTSPGESAAAAPLVTSPADASPLAPAPTPRRPWLWGTLGAAAGAALLVMWLAGSTRESGQALAVEPTATAPGASRREVLAAVASTGPAMPGSDAALTKQPDPATTESEAATPLDVAAGPAEPVKSASGAGTGAQRTLVAASGVGPGPISDRSSGESGRKKHTGGRGAGSTASGSGAAAGRSGSSAAQSRASRPGDEGPGTGPSPREVPTREGDVLIMHLAPKPKAATP